VTHRNTPISTIATVELLVGTPIGSFPKCMLHCCVVQHVEHLLASLASLQMLSRLSQPLPEPDQRATRPVAGLTSLRQNRRGEPVLISLLAQIRQPLMCCTVYLKSIVHGTPLHIKRPDQHANASLRMLEALSAINDTAV
jgi:hypothetical protein